MRSTFFVSAVFAILAAGSFAQQFVAQTGAIPGPVVWSEAIESFDCDGDGDNDVIVGNGVGFSSAQGALLPTLLINNGTAGFTDETSTRIPAAFTQQNKGLTVCDVDGDGDKDIVFANGFNTQPRILINSGAGVFTDQTSTRFPTLNLNSFGVNYGDLDNDGDLDLVFSDMGGVSGGLCRLFINNGSGVFTNTPSQMNAVAKVGAMMVNIVDIDNDFDLDVIIDGKSTGQQCYLNNGQATFTFNGTLLPGGSGSTYETDWCDLDNDNDIDGFYISMSGFTEGTARNNLIGLGTMTFTGATTTISGLNSNDDNEVAYLDYDNDGFIDPLVASLANNREKLYRNLGTLATSSLVYQTTAFSMITDSTLDLCIGDFDGDNDYDVVTAQGESGNFLNRLYLNNGSADTTAPRIGRIQNSAATVSVAAMQSTGHVVRAWVQDSVYDNGNVYLDAVLNIAATKDGVTQNSTVPMTYIGGGMFRGRIQPTVPLSGYLGMSVSWTVTATDWAGNQTTSAPSVFTVCGGDNYGVADAVNHIAIDSSPEPRINQSFNVLVSGADVNQFGILLLSGLRDSFPALGGTIYVSTSGLLTVNFATDGVGAASIPIFVPNVPGIVGFPFDVQAVVYEPAQMLSWGLSVGRECVICAP